MTPNRPRSWRRPSLTYSIRRSMVDEFYLAKSTLIEKGALVLDIGGHKTVKRGQFDIRTLDLNVLVVNIVDNKGADIIADASQLPIASASIDAVICAEVLEHVAELDRVVGEIVRVLRPGGLLLATAPFLFPVHADPHDYGRYTAQFWKWKLAGHEMEDIEISPQGGYYAVLASLVVAGGLELAKRLQKRSWLLRVPLSRAMNVAAKLTCRASLWLDRRSAHKPFHSAFTTGYGIAARKGAGIGTLQS